MSPYRRNIDEPLAKSISISSLLAQGLVSTEELDGQERLGEGRRSRGRNMSPRGRMEYEGNGERNGFYRRRNDYLRDYSGNREEPGDHHHRRFKNRHRERYSQKCRGRSMSPPESEVRELRRRLNRLEKKTFKLKMKTRRLEKEMRELKAEAPLASNPTSPPPRPVQSTSDGSSPRLFRSGALAQGDDLTSDVRNHQGEDTTADMSQN